MKMNQLTGLNMAFISGALTAAGAETVYDTTVAITYCINGKLYSKSTVADGTTPTADPVDSTTFTALAASQGCAFVWCLNSSGTVGVFQGPVADLDVSENWEDPEAPQFPEIPDAWVPFAYQLVLNGDTGSAWSFGTSNWNATGITDIIVNVATLPDRPQTDAAS